MFEKLKKLYSNIKNLNKSVDSYTKDTVIQSLPTVAYVNKAKKLIEDKQYEKAKELLNSALDISSEDARVFKYLGFISENERDFVKACEYYERSSLLDPHDKNIWLRLGMNLLYSSQFDKAILAFENANKNLPNNTDVYTGWGMTLMRQKKYALARDKFLTACKISKYNYTAILLSAVMEMRLGEYSFAEEKLEFLVKVAPNESSLYEYANLKLLQSKYEEAINYSKKALTYNKQMLPVYFVLGETYSILNDAENVEFYYNKAIEEDLDCSSLHFEYGKNYVRMANFVKARELFNLALEKESDFTEAKIGLVLLDSYNGEFGLLENFEEKHQDNVYVLEACGYRSIYDKDYETAIKYFKKVLSKDPHQIYVYIGLAQSYKGLGNNSKVKENYEKFIELNSNNADILKDYSQFLIEISAFDEANRKLKKLYKMFENDISILNMLFFTQYTLVKNNICEYNIREALTIAQKAIEVGEFRYYPEKEELEGLLENIQER